MGSIETHREITNNSERTFRATVPCGPANFSRCLDSFACGRRHHLDAHKASARGFDQLCHSERSEESRSDAGRVKGPGFFASLRMTKVRCALIDRSAVWNERDAQSRSLDYGSLRSG